MKIILLINVFFLSLFFKNFIDRIIEVDKMVYKMYAEEFKDYLEIDNNYNLIINKEKVKDDFKKKGIEIIFDEEINYKFIVKFKYFINYQKKYYFYIEKK